MYVLYVLYVYMYVRMYVMYVYIQGSFPFTLTFKQCIIISAVYVFSINSVLYTYMYVYVHVVCVVGWYSLTFCGCMCTFSWL